MRKINSDYYVLVPWPFSQEYMEFDWFEDEAILALDNKDRISSSAYFIPMSRYFENLPESAKEVIIQNVVEDLKSYLS